MERLQALNLAVQEAEETAAAMDPAVNQSPEEKGYVVKDLEPEDFGKTAGFKPFHMGEGMTMQVKAEAPKSKSFDPKDFTPYVVKDLEPEDFGKTAGFKPFHMGEGMTMQVKAEAPKSKSFDPKDFTPGSIKTSSKEFELDLEALLAETANELAQAVAEETGEQETEETSSTEVPETAPVQEELEAAKDIEAVENTEEIPEETVSVEEPVQEQTPKVAAAAESLSQALAVKAEEFDALAEEIPEETVSVEEPVQEQTPKVAAAAESLSQALAVKAEEFDALAAGMTQEVVIPRNEPENIEVTQPEEILEEQVEVIPETEEEILPAEEIPQEVVIPRNEPENIEVTQPEEILEEQVEVIPETEEEILPAEEIPEELIEETIEALEQIEIEPEELAAETLVVTEEVEPESSVESEIEEGATKEFPIEKVKEALGEIDLSKALEEELEDKDVSNQDDSHMKRVTGSVATEEGHKSTAFSTAVEGLMRHHLTEEEHRRLFTYFFPIPGMSQQINEALDTAQESACAKTSQAGNIIVTGREGSGKTRLSEGLIKALCKERQMEGAKVAYITAEKLNKKDPVAVVGKLAGGFLVVENAGNLKEEVVENMSKAMEFKTNRLTVILEDLKPGIRSLEERFPDFMKKFDSKIVIPVFTNDELVSFAKTYAKELGYKIDDMAVLALYTLIGDNQNEENPVAVGMVREMMDEAIARASRKGRKAGKKVSKRHLDETGRIMLYEKDFDI